MQTCNMLSESESNKKKGGWHLGGPNERAALPRIDNGRERERTPKSGELALSLALSQLSVIFGVPGGKPSRT